MHIQIRRDWPGIEDHHLVFSKSETNTLNKAAHILDLARQTVGEDSDLGTELGKAEMILRVYNEGAMIDSRITSEIGELF